MFKIDIQVIKVNKLTLPVSLQTLKYIEYIWQPFEIDKLSFFPFL